MQVVSDLIGGGWFRETVFLKRWHLNKDVIKVMERTSEGLSERAIQVGALWV